MTDELIRSFIAIELPPVVKQELTTLEAVLKKRCAQVVRWVDPPAIHLTLKFLGDVSSDRIDEINMAIDEATQGLSPFRLELQEVGAFPNLNRVQVVWVGMKGELDKLAYLQKQIEANTEQLGFPREERAFTPHLTLGRVRNYTSPDDRKKLGLILSQTAFASSQIITVESVNLMKSQLTGTGAIYTRLYASLLKW
ncbi:MAG TPA: RNA 2',3'-cyclic phosphodiesterase [Dehalococcoidales bacterium]